MDRAISAVKEGGISVREVARHYSVPRSTLQRAVKGTSNFGQRGPKKPVFSAQQETELAQHLIRLQKMMYGLTTYAVRKLAYQYAEGNGIDHPFSKEKCVAGVDWLEGFLQRNMELGVRSPEPTSLSRLTAFNKVQVTRFFDLLRAVFDGHTLTADRIYNMDESGISTVPTKTSKIVAQKGSKQVGIVSSAEKGETTTIVCCFNASGTLYIPPAMIFKRKKIIDALLKGAPDGAIAFPSEKGWMTENIFPQWLGHFIKYAKPAEHEQFLLILDNHASHCSLAAIEKAQANNIIMLTLPPHSSHKMQPLDKTFFFALKTAYEKECYRFLLNHPGKRITPYDLAEIFGSSYKKSCTMEKAVNGFASTGIWPFNPDIFTEADFAAAEVTERDDPASFNPSEPQPSTSHQPARDPPEPQPSTSHQPARDPPESQPSTSHQPARDSPEPQPSISHQSTCDPPEPQPSTSHQSTCDPPEPQPSTFHQSTCDHPESQPQPSTSRQLTFDPPGRQSSLQSWQELSPIPKVDRPAGGKKRKNQSANLITSSPFKAMKVAQEDSKQKEGKQNVGKYVNTKNNVAKKVSGKGKGKAPKKKPNNSIYYCIFCNEQYVDPPTEDWIMCKECKLWAHEHCADPDWGPLFTCDLCS